MFTRCPTYSSATAQEESGSTVGHMSGSQPHTNVLDPSGQSPWKTPVTHIRPFTPAQTAGCCTGSTLVLCALQRDCSADPTASATSPTMRVCLCQGCCKWFQLQAVFAVSLLLLSLPQKLDFKCSESCWPSVWFSWSFCQQGNRDGSPLSVGGEITPAATNEVAWQAFYSCLPVFQCLCTKHECLIKDSSAFLFFSLSWGKRMLTKGVSILKFCVEI